MKFDGSSLASAGQICHVVEIVKTCIDRKPILVLPAIEGATDLLLEAGEAALEDGMIRMEKIVDIHQKIIADLKLDDMALKEEVRVLLVELQDLLTGISLIEELTEKTKDHLSSIGERLAVRIVAAYFNSLGIRACAVDAWDGGFLSDSNFTAAELVDDSWNLIPAKLFLPADEGILQIVTGSLAKDEEGDITTLGTGGADFSAAIIASSCGAEEVQIWKEVDGIHSADPKIVRNARLVETVSYEAASELAHFGTEVLHPQAIEPCMKTNTPVLVKNFNHPEAPGTRIVQSLEEKASSIQAITSRKNVTLVDIVSTRMLGQFGFLAEVFSCFAKYGFSVDMVATSEVSVSLTVNSANDLTALKKDLSRIARVDIHSGKTIITIIGDVSRSSEILARSFRICELLGVPVQMVSQGASKVNISFIVDDHEAADVIKALHGVSLKPKGGLITSNVKMKVVLVGYGKMGRLLETRLREKGHKVIAVVDPFYAGGTSSPPSGAAVYATLKEAMEGPEGKNLKEANVAFEFTRQETALENILYLARENIPVVTGTTGWYEKLPEVIRAVQDAESSLIWSSNFSQGVNLFYRIASYAAKLADPFAEYEVAGVETHHNKKADSPSGTAKTLVEKVLAQMTRKKKAVYELHDRPPKADELHYASVRVGSVPGTHSLMFDSPADTIEITHTARNREGFAAGAVLAAEWLVEGKRIGVFTIDDVLADLLPAI